MNSDHKTRSWTSRGWGVMVLLILNLAPLYAQTSDEFDPNANNIVTTAAELPDGKILVGGHFTTLGGLPCDRIGRLEPDGTLDMTFNPGADGPVLCLVVQTDGRVLVGGSFAMLGGKGRANLGRLNADGSLDAAFDPNANGSIYALAVQSDGKILVGGEFTRLGGQSRTNLGRFNADGTVDATFDPSTDARVYSLALQADGGIVVGGSFTMLGGQTRCHIGRLKANGTLDTSFDPGVDLGTFSHVEALALQADGKILVGGSFSFLGGQLRSSLGRLNSDGTLDTAFNPQTSSTGVKTLAVQADGKILVGGSFTLLSGQPRNHIGRLNGDGSVDTAFNPGAGSAASGYVCGLAVQADGKILVCGAFANVAGQVRNCIGRLNNTERATQNLTYDGTTITWLRGGTSPEVWSATFEASTNGIDWTSLGSSQHVMGGWLLTATNLTTLTTIRAHGFVAGGQGSGSGWFVEAMVGAPGIISQPVSQRINAGTTATLNVTAGGTEPLSYQWCRAATGLSDGANISGTSTPRLILSNAFGGDAGGYSVTVSNAFGAVTSMVATLSVVDPFIRTHPSPQIASPGQPAQLAIAVVGTAPLFYQWRKNGVIMEGATASALTLTNVQPADIGNYDVMVSNLYGSVLSAPAAIANPAVPDAFDPQLGPQGADFVYSLAIQTDGKILVGGRFTVLGGANAREPRAAERGWNAGCHIQLHP